MLRHHISSIAFATGFVWDTLTLKRIDLVYENFVFISYLLIAFTAIILVHAVEAGRITTGFLVKYRAWLPAFIQFPLGGLFSGFVIFYTKSASWLTSWPFLLLLLLMFVGNEFFRRRYERLVFQVTVFFFALTSYLILVTPVVLGRVSASVFVLSTVLAAFVMALLLQVVMRLFPQLYARSVKGIWLSIGSVFFAFHLFYFANIIPPVPLTLKEIGVYHSVVRAGDEYRVAYEAPKWYEFFRTTHGTYHRKQNEAAYCFSAIAAPTDLTADVHHSWQRHTSSGWVREERIPYRISGGRASGYRGYSIKSALSPGKWRCVVELDDGTGRGRGQVIGQATFVVEESEEPLVLVHDTR